ncbi:hypothetical protein P355_2245 [Burkholderia cenocepacia KC-01]|nr:hypothetical protein P355_2245 [Burkholderia cenocepacia KC-01]
MRVIKSRDYKWDRDRSSRSVPCFAGPPVSCAAPARGGQPSQTIFHARN